MRGIERKAFLLLAPAMFVLTATAAVQTRAAPKPLMRDFIGLNVHTVLFKPDLYRPAIRQVRDYHPFSWDVGDDPSWVTPFPLARNRVDWGEVYGSWKRDDYGIDVSVMIDDVKPSAWKDPAAGAYAYGYRFARFFGPSGTRKLASSVEIGNEPGDYPDSLYRTVFLNAARGIRKADPKMKIVTCNTTPGPSGTYAKSLDLFKGLDYDVISVHDYAQVEGYPTWRRSYPEDPLIPYLTDVRNTLRWRDKNAPGKPVWITEFGWDSTTQPQAKTGDFRQWVGVTDTQQAEYLVRSLLVFSSMDVGKAFIYFFDDDDKPQVHGSSGLTRHGVPKPSFYAVAHLQKTLGEYRFSRVIEAKTGGVYVYEYHSGTDPASRIWAVWSPTGSGRRTPFLLKAKEVPGTLLKAERMPLGPDEPPRETIQTRRGDLRLDVDEAPLYLTFKTP